MLDLEIPCLKGGMGGGCETKLSIDNVRNTVEDRWREKYGAYRMQRGTFQDRKKELGALSHWAAPNFSAALGVLT